MAEYKITPEELKYKLSLSLSHKVDLTCERIEQWHEHYNGLIYVAFSGGMDSTVLLDIVRNKAFIPDAKSVPAVFNDTGLEYPEIRNFVKTIDNVVWLKPKLTFKEVIEKYGYPLISKDQSKYLYELRRTKSDKLKDLRLNGNKWGLGKISKKWKFLIDAPFNISHKCCDELKKKPAIIYEKQTGRKAIVGIRTGESQQRQVGYMQKGCNAYDSVRPISMPLAFWTDKDIIEYIEKYNIPYSPIYDMGYDRTGCMFCMFGVSREKHPNKFQKMKITHPKIYEYCINKLGLGYVLDYIDVDYK